MKINIVILFFCCSIILKAQIFVEMEFDYLSFSQDYVVTGDDWPGDDQLRFKHRIDSNPFSDCANKDLGVFPGNNTTGLGGGYTSATIYSSSFSRSYQYWEDDIKGGCSMDDEVCDPFCGDDDRKAWDSYNVSLSAVNSGTWFSYNTFYGSGANIYVHYKIKWTMPTPVTPSKQSGIKYTCGNTVEIISTSNRLPAGFNEITEYEWSYCDDTNSGIYTVITTTSTPLLSRSIPNVSGFKNVGYKVRTRYRYGEWSPLSDPGTFDVYPAAPTFTSIVPTAAKCYNELSGQIKVTGLTNTIGDHKFTISFINTDTGEPDFKSLDGSQGTSDIVLPQLFSGHYQVIIKNGNNIDDASATITGECHTTNIPSVYVNQPASLPSIIAAAAIYYNGTPYNVTCNTNSNTYQSNGVITITAMGGTLNSQYPDYRFFDLVNFGLTISPVNNLPANSYTIKVMDGNDCVSQFPFLVTVLSPLIMSIPGINQNANRSNNTFSISCFQGSNGILSVQTNSRGNVGNIQYQLWKRDNSIYQTQPVAYNAIANFPGLPEGAYKIKATDALGCTVEETNSFVTGTGNNLYLDQPPKLEIVTVQRPVEITNVTNYNNIYNGFDFSCSYNQDSYANVIAQGGISFKNYTYAIIGGPGTQNTIPASHFYNLHQKVPYTFRVTDDNGCTTVKGITLDRIPDTLKVQSLTKTTYNGFHISCNTENEQYDANGSVSIVGVGGVLFKPFTYQYIGNAVSTNTGSVLNNPLPGNIDGHGRIFKRLPWNLNEYQFNDENGCVLTGNFFLSQPSQLSVTGISSTIPYCHHFRDGLFNVTLTGGVYPQYQSIFKQQYQEHTELNGDKANKIFITRTLPGSALVIDSVDAGRYRIDIKDINGCTIHQDQIPMDEPKQLSVNNKTGHVPCKDGGNGRFTTTATGGTFPYRAWMDGTLTGIGSPNITFTGLSNKDYALYLTDAHNCNNFESATAPGANQGVVSVKAPDYKLEFKGIVLTYPSCFGYSDGVIKPVWKGGYETGNNISFSLDSVNYISDEQSFENKSPGSYRLILQETNEGGVCVVTSMVSLQEIPPLSLTGIKKDIVCYNEKNGMIILSATGGNGGYLYSVTGESLSSNATFTGFDIGSYSATVKDNNNCPVNTLTFAITEPSLLVGNFDAHFSTCGDANGSITFSGTGGTQPYSFRPLTPKVEITNTQVLSIMYQVPSGLHGVELKDAHKCTTTITGLVNDLNGPTVLGMLVKPASCSYSSDGASKITIKALSASLYKTIWTDRDTVSKSLEANQLKGSVRYTALVEDIYGCKGGDTVWVPAPAVLRVEVTGGMDPRCANESNGSLSAMATGGAYPYQYAWDDIQNQKTATANGLSAISDDTLRIRKYNVKALDVNGCTATGIGSLYNPMGVVVTLTSYSGVICEGQVKILNGGIPLYTRGNTSYQWSGSNGYRSNTPKSLASVAGIYTITATDGLGCSADTVFTLTTSRNLLKALYGASSNVSVGDTIILVEYSWPSPDSVEYTLPSSFTLVTASGDQMYTSVVPQEEGTYELSIKVALSDCQDQLTKHIHVGARTVSGSNLRLGYEGITEASLYPNPAGQYTILSLTLTDEMPITIQIRRAEGKDAVWQSTLDGKEKNEIQIDLSNFLSGVYVIYTSTENSVKVLKLTVVR